jgi:hypothetical protein
MRTPTAASTNPWGNSIDDGWKDLVVSSAPPPPPREAMAEPVVRNRVLPAGISTWQEHGARAASPSVETPAEEPNFTAGDRRLWLVAGTLMGLATLVLAMLGLLTFGNGAVAVESASEAPRAAVAEPIHAVSPAHESARAAAVAKSSNPRVLKASSRTKHGRHHNKPIASR